MPGTDARAQGASSARIQKPEPDHWLIKRFKKKHYECMKFMYNVVVVLCCAVFCGVVVV